MRWISFLFLSALLSGCSTQTTSIGRTVIVRAGFPDRGIEQALTLAETECRKQSLHASVRSVTSPISDRYMFECVE